MEHGAAVAMPWHPSAVFVSSVLHGFLVTATGDEVWVSGQFGCAAKFTASGFAVFGGNYLEGRGSDYEAWVEFTEGLESEFGIQLEASHRPKQLFLRGS